MSFERYLAGNRVYRHGSSAPTVGTVDPSGYVDRELRKRRMTSPMDPSQSRSGLASAALNRIQTMNGTAPKPAMDGMGNAMPTPAGSQTALDAKIAAVRAQHADEQAQQKAKLASRPTVSSTGKITSTKKATPAKPTALPWDMQAQQQKIDAGDVLGQLRNQLMQGRQGAQRDYSNGVHQLDTEQPTEARGLLNQFAGRGLAFGSGYGVGVGNQQDKFANARSGLSQHLSDLLNGYQNQESQGNATYNSRLGAIQQALAQRLSSQAGKLGLGGK